LRRGGTLNEVDTAATATLTAIMGRLAAYSGTEVTWDDTLNSKETLAPKPAHSLTDIPPTQPDKFGDYATPVRG
ncbi:MAG TPA: dehydrogenase, partial [Planctomycetaceae bacterium]|nr:dehydrogenase [Planctomycetaceae bacterium]